jgi:hypothetical protein
MSGNVQAMVAWVVAPRPALARSLLRCARHPSAGALVAFVLGRLGPWLPLREAGATRDFLLFRHPVASADRHVLIVPRRYCPTLHALDAARFAEVIALGRARAADWGDVRFEGHTLSINGGVFQDVKQAHFHLTNTSSRPRVDGCRACAEAVPLFTTERAILRQCAPGELDVVCHDEAPMPDGAAAAAPSVLKTVHAFLAERGDRVRGYRLLFGRPPCGCAEASWFRLLLLEREAFAE